MKTTRQAKTKALKKKKNARFKKEDKAVNSK